MNMTWEEVARRIAELEKQRDAEYAARCAAITPHVRRSPKKQPQRMSGPRYFNLMRAMERDPEAYADYRPTTYCGAALTTEDWDRRSALAKKNAALVIDAGVCPDCLQAAREESNTSGSERKR